jgi:hypothetical protein
MQEDPEVYSLFLEEAKSRGYYNEKRIRNQTLQYARKEYFNSYIDKDNKRFEGNWDQEFKKFILHRETELNR